MERLKYCGQNISFPSFTSAWLAVGWSSLPLAGDGYLLEYKSCGIPFSIKESIVHCWWFCTKCSAHVHKEYWSAYISGWEESDCHFYGHCYHFSGRKQSCLHWSSIYYLTMPCQAAALTTVSLVAILVLAQQLSWWFLWLANELCLLFWNSWYILLYILDCLLNMKL